MKYRYLISGITIASDIYFPEMLQTAEEAEVTLQYGGVPEHLETNLVDFPVVEANASQYLLKIPGIGRYLVEDGSKITMQAEDGAALKDVNNYVLTSVLGALSYMKGFVPLHGGAFIFNGKAVLILGLSGMGKSSLLAALHQNGYTILADDISNVKVIDGKAMLYPGFPRIMLWQDTIRKLALDGGPCDKVRGDMEKYFLPLSPAFFNQPVEIDAIYLLREDVEENSPLAVKGMVKVNQLRANLFQPWMADLNLMDTRSACFGQILLLSSPTAMYYFGNNRVLSLNELCNTFIATVIKNAE
jgi:hypothetical protein